MAEWASNAKGNAALTTGIIGTAGVGLGLLGGLANMANGVNCNRNCDHGNDTAMAAAIAAMAASTAPRTTFVPACSEDHTVNRYEAGQAARIAELETQVKLLEANTYTDQKILEVYKYFDGELKDVRGELCNQRVHNQRTEDSFTLARQDLAAVKAELECQIRNEAEKRCCGDNAIVNYVNATFYPKMVADVTTGTETTAQSLFNPIPKCGCNGCGC